MRYTILKSSDDGFLGRLLTGLQAVLDLHGHIRADADDPDLGLAIQVADPAEPRPFRRQSRGTFVVTIMEGEDGDNLLQRAYPYLVRTLSNLLVYVTDTGGRRTLHFVTPELGHYQVGYDAADESAFFEEVYRRLKPLAQSRFVLDNIFEPDLPRELWDGNETTRALAEAGRRLAALDLLPAPFPLDQYLSPRDLRHLKLLYGIGGLSYGNLSARHEGDTFWMSASGIDKSQMEVVGRDILLVKGYDPERQAMILSVAADREPRRVSVDAIEHWMIYREHPEVGAIIHIHAWMDGVPSTEINYPCGTYELATSVAELVRRSPDPAAAVIGLRNHGLTITGRSLDDIFERIEGRIQRQVPMV
ncbi:MAG: class II aldolase/adducin family protein [Clostridia bacterium]|nr:class II aldolase/adducin family protein [Clostridia bacterium]